MKLAVILVGIVIYYYIGTMSIYRNIVWFMKGYREYTRSGYETASKNFNPKDIEVDCSTKSFIVTGANSGLGYEAALEIAKRDGTVHMICRNESLGTKAKDQLVEQTKNKKIYLHIVDMSKPKEIRDFTSSFASKYQNLNVLVNNAGCLVNERKLTEDNLDVNFATNTLGYYLMTKGLLDSLSKSEEPRVIFVSSGGMLTQKLDFSDLNLDKMTNYDGVAVYAQNKRAQVVMCEQFAKSYPNIHFSSMHPGWSNTPGVQTSLPDFYEKFKDKLRSSSQGADTLVWLAVSPAAKGFTSGSFFQDRVPVSTHLPLAWTKTSETEDNDFMKRLSEIESKV